MNVTSPLAAAPAVCKSSDSLGCKSDKLRMNQQLDAGELTLYRKATDSDRFGCVETPASGRGFLLGVSMSTGHQRRILRDGRASAVEFEQGSIYTRDFTEDYRADLHGAFDFLLFEIPIRFLDRFSDERGGRRVSALAGRAGEKDPVLFHLAQALAPALRDPLDANGLFVEQMGLTVCSHIASQYGDGREALCAPRKLSRLHEARAKDMLLSHVDGDISIAEIAQACQLSRSHFIQAFRETTGETPYQWLMRRRLDRARDLLRASELNLAEVALASGFADQSHFTRFFKRVVGVAPGQWRRELRA